MTERTAVGYIWISPDNKDPQALIEQDEKIVSDYCKTNNISFLKTFSDIGVTGPAIDRPELNQMLEFIKEKNINIVVVGSLGNFGRRFHDSLTIMNKLTEKNIDMHSISENFGTLTEEGRSILKSLSKITELTQKIIPLKTERRRKRAREVAYAGGACPYGYKIDEKTNQYVIIPEEAAIVRRIFRERLAGRSLRQIAGDLTKEGVTTKRGGRWQANTIKTILENIFYTGVYQFHDNIYPDDHDEIISEHVFYLVNAMEDKGD